MMPGPSSTRRLSAPELRVPEPDGYGPECSLPLPWGGELRAPAWPEECDYVRIIRADGSEALCWNQDDWSSEPSEVMGAILGASIGGPLETTTPKRQGATS